MAQPQDMTAEMFPNPGQALCQCRLRTQFYTLETRDLSDSKSRSNDKSPPFNFLIISQTNEQEKLSAFEMVLLDVWVHGCCSVSQTIPWQILGAARFLSYSLNMPSIAANRLTRSATFVSCIHIPSELSQWRISSARCTGSVFLQNQSAGWKFVELTSLPLWIASVWVLLANLEVSDCMIFMDLCQNWIIYPNMATSIGRIIIHHGNPWDAKVPYLQTKPDQTISCMMFNLNESFFVCIFSRNHTSQFLCQGSCSTDAESNDAANLPQQKLPKPKTLSASGKKLCKRNNWCHSSLNKMMFNDFWRPTTHTCTPTHVRQMQEWQSLLKAWSPSCRPVARIWRDFEMHGET